MSFKNMGKSLFLRYPTKLVRFLKFSRDKKRRKIKEKLKNLRTKYFVWLCGRFGHQAYGTLINKHSNQKKVDWILKELGKTVSSKFPAKSKSLGRSVEQVVNEDIRLRMDLVPVDLQPQQLDFDRTKLDIHWVIPDFASGMGGHMTIFRMIRLLELLGHKNTIWIYKRKYHQDVEEAYDELVKHYQLCSAKIEFVDAGLARAAGDVVIASNWISVNYVNTTYNFKRRFYFVQDYEPYFSPSGSRSLLAKRTYSDDFDCICASPWLKKVISEDHGRWAMAFWLAADQSVYNVLDRQAKQTGRLKIAFFAKIKSPRRAVELGLLAFEYLAKRGIDFELNCFGDNLSFTTAPFDFVDHGILRPTELAKLYATCDLGVVFSATNYSLVPKEMMACGLPVAELDSDCARVVFPSNVITLLSPDPRQMASELKTLIVDSKRRIDQAEHALQWVKQFTWEGAAKSIEIAIVDRLIDKGFTALAPQPHTKIKASVIIPTLNAGEAFQQVIHAVKSQKAPWEFEIVVIDSGSTDGTIEFIEAFKDISLHHIAKSDFQHGSTRNRAIGLTNGEYIALLTQDAQPKNDYWLYNLVAALEHFPHAAGAFGRHQAYPDADPFTKRDLESIFRRYNQHPLCVSKDLDPGKWNAQDTRWRKFLHFYSNNNSCMRRSVWEKIPFPRVDFGEDQIWASKIIEAGYQKLYVDKAIVYHSHNYDEYQTEERAFTEANYLLMQFGYKPCAPEDAQEKIQERNRIDIKYAKSHQIDEVLTERRLKLNAAKVAGSSRASKLDDGRGK